MDIKLMLSIYLFVQVSMCQEPYDSRFTFLEQVLEKLVRMEARMATMEEQLKLQQKAELQPVVQQHARNVAFCATATNSMDDMVSKQVLTFDNVLINVGNAYNNNTGTFTAPEDGTYYFQTTVLTKAGGEIWGYIAVNEAPKTWFSAKAPSNRHVSATQTLVVTLNKTERVTINNCIDKGHIYGNHYTTFAGYLLF